MRNLNFFWCPNVWQGFYKCKNFFFFFWNFVKTLQLVEYEISYILVNFICYWICSPQQRTPLVPRMTKNRNLKTFHNFLATLNYKSHLVTPLQFAVTRAMIEICSKKSVPPGISLLQSLWPLNTNMVVSIMVYALF